VAVSREQRHTRSRQETVWSWLALLLVAGVVLLALASKPSDRGLKEWYVDDKAQLPPDAFRWRHFFPDDAVGQLFAWAMGQLGEIVIPMWNAVLRQDLVRAAIPAVLPGLAGAWILGEWKRFSERRVVP
jgi:hypothetical protein